MAKLNAKARRGLRSSDFALPKQRKYPIHDRSHQVNAKARATQMHKRGKLSGKDYSTVTRKATKRLGFRGVKARA
jgi:hypothetical protein